MVLAEKDSTPNGGQCRLDILNTLAKWLLGNTGNLEKLMHYMNTRRLSYFSKAISDELRANMAEICALKGWYRSARFALVPMNSPDGIIALEDSNGGSQTAAGRTERRTGWNVWGVAPEVGTL